MESVSLNNLDKFNKGLEQLDMQGTLTLLNILAQRALYLQMNPEPKKNIIELPKKKIVL